MKIRKIKDRIWKKHITIDSLNKKRRLKMLHTQSGTFEQLELARACVKIDEHLMKYATKQIKKQLCNGTKIYKVIK